MGAKPIPTTDDETCPNLLMQTPSDIIQPLSSYVHDETCLILQDVYCNEPEAGNFVHPLSFAAGLFLWLFRVK